MSEHDEFQSQYPKLDRPSFEPRVPSHLLKQMTDEQRYMIEALSITEQQNEWMINAALENNRIYRDLDRRIQKGTAQTDARLQNVEGWQKMVTSKWSVAVAIILWLSPLVGKLLWDRYTSDLSKVQKAHVETKSNGAKQ